MNWQEFYKLIQETYQIENEDTVIKIPFENIIDVTANELVYKNCEGEIAKINLYECVKNFSLMWKQTPKNIHGQPLQCIGGRRFPFYEFFTSSHHTRFYVNVKKTAFKRFLTKIGWNAYSKERSIFYSLQRKLNAVGFTSLDLA